MTDIGWFAARPSGTENIYKIYAESFRDQAHLDAIVSEAKAIVGAALAGGVNARTVTSRGAGGGGAVVPGDRRQAVGTGNPEEARRRGPWAPFPRTASPCSPGATDGVICAAIDPSETAVYREPNAASGHAGSRCTPSRTPRSRPTASPTNRARW